MPNTRFVVKRLRWLPNSYDDKLTRLPGETPVASFATIDEADADCRTREEAVRKVVNPFFCADMLHYLTHFDEPRLRDWLMDHGIDPPQPQPDGATDWAAWWKKNHKKLSADKRAAVWEALGKVRFFTIAEEPVRPVGYAVVQINWVYNDEYYDADPEGGRLLTVYRSRKKAEEECETLNGLAREEWGDVFQEFGLDPDEFDPDEQLEMFNMEDRLRVQRGLLDPKGLKDNEGVFGSADGVPFFEVIEVELEGLQ